MSLDLKGYGGRNCWDLKRALVIAAARGEGCLNEATKKNHDYIAYNK